MKLSIYAIDSWPLVAVKAIREALRKLRGASASLSDAQIVVRVFEADGVAVLAHDLSLADRDDIMDLIEALKANGVFATLGDPRRAARAHEAEKMRAAGSTPEQIIAAQAPGEPAAAPEAEPARIRPDAAQATATALMAMTDGNPLRAAIYASTLCRAQGEFTRPVWAAVQQHIISVFPWIKDMLESDPNGVIL